MILDAKMLPRELRGSDRAVVWNYGNRNGSKLTKLPYSPLSPQSLAAVDDPATWGSLEQAIELVESGAVDGVGIVLGDGLVGVDFDNCIDPVTNEVDEEVYDLVLELNSYTEISPSGNGLHVLVRGELPPGRRRNGKLEIYDADRYFTLTGEHVEWTPTTIEERTAQLSRIHAARLGGTSTSSNAPTRASAASQSAPDTSGMSDDALIVRARSARNGELFSMLWEGDCSGYESQSNADQALCNILSFWTGGDSDRIDELFRQSGLMRPKWDESRGSQTYGERTIERAITDMPEPAEAVAFESPFKVEAPPCELANLDPAWWESRESLQRIRDHALSRTRGPDAVFGARMLIENALAGPGCVIEDTGTGENLSSNMQVLVPGHPSTDKGAAYSAAVSSLDLSEEEKELVDGKLGSGQGLIDSYLEEQKEDGKPVLKQVRDRAVFFVSEVSGLAKLFDNKAAMLSEILREAFYAESLGQTNSKAGGRSRKLRAGSYTLGVYVSGQPELCGSLLGEEAVLSGSAARVLVLSPHAHMDHLEMRPDRPEADSVAVSVNPSPSALQIHRIRESGTGWPLTMDPELVEENRARRLELKQMLRRVDRVSPEASGSGHRIALQAKVAAYLARLDARMHITREDWDLAAHVMAVSAYNARAIGKAIAEQAMERAIQSGQLRGAQEAAQVCWKESRKEELQKRIVRQLRREGPQTEAMLKRNLLDGKQRKTDGPILSEALDALCVDGTIARVEAARAVKYEIAKNEPAQEAA